VLVLTRKPGEKVRIGSNITLVVLSAVGNRVRIGIDAAAAVRIVRQELIDHPAGDHFNHKACRSKYLRHADKVS
jgi:carbon storage regulator CsrA